MLELPGRLSPRDREKVLFWEERKGVHPPLPVKKKSWRGRGTWISELRNLFPQGKKVSLTIRKIAGRGEGKEGP